MPGIRQSLVFWCFARSASVEELSRFAAAEGFEGLEMAPEEHWPAIRAAGLAIPIVGGFGPLHQGLNDPEQYGRILPALRAQIRKAAEHEIPALIVFSGNRQGLADDAGVTRCADALRQVIGEAEAAGVTLCMELLNSRVDHPDYQCDRTEWGVQVCEAVGSPRCKLLYDIYHMQIMEGDLIRTIRKHIRHIGHFHTAGNPGRRDLDAAQEISYPAVMRAIAETGYTGFVGHEFTPKGDWAAALRQAHAACNV